MELIWKKLKSLGWEEDYVRTCILPDWWSDDLAEDPINKRQAELILSKGLGIPFEEIINLGETLTVKTDNNSSICKSLGKAIKFNSKE